MSKNRKILLILLGFLALILIFISYITFQSFKPVDAAGRAVDFEIKPNTSTIQIAEDLENKGLIKSKWLFVVFLKLNRRTIQAGIYEISPSDNLSKIASILTEGQVKNWVITFPEGFSLKDIAAELDQKKIVKKEDFLNEATQVSKYSKKFPFLTSIKSSNLEGYLFPDTYRFSFKTTSSEIVSKMLSNFDKKVNSKIKDEVKNQGKNLNEVIILASIIEREAKKDEDRPKIASVYLNRLAKNMKLEADPTIQYAKGSWEPITIGDYQSINSPYNTYKYTGLPPGPIANPGLASILAVLNPAKTNYLYFFSTKTGEAIYSVTEDEHDQKKKELLK